MSNIDAIQRIELSCYDVPLHCPFCGHEVVTDGAKEGATESWVDPCEHTLFAAHDVGFEYRAPRFNEQMGLDDSDNPDPDIGDDDIDSFTDKVKLPNAVKYAVYVPAPSHEGTYVGFAPLVE